MTAKEYLCGYHNLLEKIAKKKEYIAFCDQRAKSVPSPNYSEPRVDHTPPKEAYFEKWVIRSSDAQRELEDLEAQLPKVKADIESTISKLENVDFQMLLTYRYIDWMLWSEICAKLCCSLQTVYRWHREALEKVDTM